MSGSSWSIPVSAGGDLGSERAGADGASGHPFPLQGCSRNSWLCWKKKKINDVFCNSARGGALAGGTERCPAIRAVPCPPLHLRVADKTAGRASVKGTYPGPDISPEKPHRSEKPGSSQRRTEGGGGQCEGHGAAAKSLGGGEGGSPGGTPRQSRSRSEQQHHPGTRRMFFSTPNAALLLPGPNNTSRGCKREGAGICLIKNRCLKKVQQNEPAAGARPPAEEAHPARWQPGLSESGFCAWQSCRRPRRLPASQNLPAPPAASISRGRAAGSPKPCPRFPLGSALGWVSTEISLNF